MQVLLQTDERRKPKHCMVQIIGCKTVTNVLKQIETLIVRAGGLNHTTSSSISTNLFSEIHQHIGSVIG